eukprot:2796528-Prymnesium_polylepis.1
MWLQRKRARNRGFRVTPTASVARVSDTASSTALEGPSSKLRAINPTADESVARLDAACWCDDTVAEPNETCE